MNNASYIWPERNLNLLEDCIYQLFAPKYYTSGMVQGFWTMWNLKMSLFELSSSSSSKVSIYYRPFSDWKEEMMDRQLKVISFEEMLEELTFGWINKLEIIFKCKETKNLEKYSLFLCGGKINIENVLGREYWVWSYQEGFIIV